MLFPCLLAPGSRAVGRAAGGQHGLPAPRVESRAFLTYAGDERLGRQLEGNHNNEASLLQSGMASRVVLGRAV